MENASTIRRVRRSAQPLAGRKGSTAKSPAKRTTRTDGNGFLNHSFQPFWGVAFPDWQKAEQEFFGSVANLCALYGWNIPDVSGLNFPANIREAYQQIIAQESKRFTLNVGIHQDEQRACCLATTKNYDTCYQLYYIPVRPLWEMRARKTDKELYRLLCRIFAYLYQVAGIPFFSEPGLLNSNYETIQNWIEEEQDVEEETFRRKQKKELRELEKAGKILLPEIQSLFRQADLEACLLAYRKQCRGDQEMIAVAEEFIKLVRDYPKRRIRETMSYDAEADDNNTIYWEQYISFYWSSNDCLNETLFQMVNDEFQEMSYQEEPTCLQWFDRPQEQENHVFDYEPRLFSLLNSLTGILNEYDNEEPNE